MTDGQMDKLTENKYPGWAIKESNIEDNSSGAHRDCWRRPCTDNNDNNIGDNALLHRLYVVPTAWEYTL